MKFALLVGDGATMCHFTDYVRVADRVEAVGGDHIAVKIHALAFRFVLALREGGGKTRQQGQYDEQAFHSFDLCG